MGKHLFIGNYIIVGLNLIQKLFCQNELDITSYVRKPK
jgi:hypothetical protein